MPTIADLRDPFVRAGIPIETAPDFFTNGRDRVLTLRDPTCGYLHHTVATQLVSVYWDRTGTSGWPHEEWRPEVPAPRCNLYGARARPAGCRAGCPYDNRAHVVFCSNGKANHAGWANLSRIQAARAGRIDHGVIDAAAAGLADDYSAAGFESVGWEFDWNVGEDWPDDLLDMAAVGVKLTADLFWDGDVGHWILHRQATNRKPDWQYPGDIWTRANTITAEEPDDMADAEVLDALKTIANKLDVIYNVGFASRGPDGKPDATHEAVSVRGVNAELDRVVAAGGAQQRLLEQLAAGQVETNRLLAQLAAAAAPVADPVVPPAGF